MSFNHPMPKLWIRHLEEECKIGDLFKGMRVAGRDERGTIVHLGGAAYKILHNGKNEDVFGNPLPPTRGIDPDFGYTTIGSYSIAIAFLVNARRKGSAWTMPAGGGTANYIKAYIKSGVTDIVDCKVFINQKDSGGANTHGQIATKENLACAAAAHWEEFTLAGESLTGGVDYILNIDANSDDVTYGQEYEIYYNENGAGAVASYEGDQTYCSEENPWVKPPDATTRDYSIYCGYSVPPVPPANPLIGKPLIGAPMVGRPKIR